MRAGDLAPDNPDVGAPNLTLGPVDESDLLAQVEPDPVLALNSSRHIAQDNNSLCTLSGVNTVELDQTVMRQNPDSYNISLLESVPCVGVKVMLGALVAQVATPKKQSY